MLKDIYWLLCYRASNIIQSYFPLNAEGSAEQMVRIKPVGNKIYII